MTNEEQVAELQKLDAEFKEWLDTMLDSLSGETRPIFVMSAAVRLAASYCINMTNRENTASMWATLIQGTECALQAYTAEEE